MPIRSRTLRSHPFSRFARVRRPAPHMRICADDGAPRHIGERASALRYTVSRRSARARYYRNVIITAKPGYGAFSYYIYAVLCYKVSRFYGILFSLIWTITTYSTHARRIPRETRRTVRHMAIWHITYNCFAHPPLTPLPYSYGCWGLFSVARKARFPYGAPARSFCESTAFPSRHGVTLWRPFPLPLTSVNAVFTAKISAHSLRILLNSKLFSRIIKMPTASRGRQYFIPETKEAAERGSERQLVREHTYVDEAR